MKFLLFFLIFSIISYGQQDISEIEDEIDRNFINIEIPDYDKYLIQVDSATCHVKSLIYLWRSCTAYTGDQYEEK